MPRRSSLSSVEYLGNTHIPVFKEGKTVNSETIFQYLKAECGLDIPEGLKSAALSFLKATTPYRRFGNMSFERDCMAFFEPQHVATFGEHLARTFLFGFFLESVNVFTHSHSD